MSKNLFNSVELQRPNSNSFDLTHDVKLSMKMGDLVPVLCSEAIPGDYWKIGAETLVRFAPLIAPVMHRINLTIHYFFVPYRILWPNWQNYITGTPNPATGLPYVFPTATIPTTLPLPNSAYAIGSLADYLGIPPPISGAVDPNFKVNVMPFNAYQKIYTEYYRDENLVTAAVDNWVPLSDGTSNSVLLTGVNGQLRKRAWEHDYFTSSLPFAQKGTAVQIPLGSVVLKTNTPGTNPTPGFVANSDYTVAAIAGALSASGVNTITTPSTPGATYDPRGSLTVAPTTINDLRRAYRLQEWLERNARGGTRYTESLLAHFGVVSSDKRLQRPEFICGVKSPIVISEIVNTGGDTATVPQGNMSGHAMGVGSGRMGTYRVEEHGLIMGILNVQPKTAYQQGLPRLFAKYTDQFDFFWPEFANIGEQEVFMREIYNGQSTALDSQVFGYVPRYAEYKFENARVAGEFRTTLSFWHLGRIFTLPPALNKTFIESVPRTDIFAVTAPGTQNLYCHVLNKLKVRRLMPKYGTPRT